LPQRNGLMRLVVARAIIHVSWPEDVRAEPGSNLRLDPALCQHRPVTRGEGRQACPDTRVSWRGHMSTKPA
jgi:hypothetical protein